MRILSHSLVTLAAFYSTSVLAIDKDDALEKAFNDPNIVKLTPANFEETVKTEKPMLVEFYANWCGHCKTLAPEYAKAAEALKEDKITLASIDCTNHQEFCGKQGVSGYPTIRVYKKGEHEKYEGTRKAEGIVKYMKKYDHAFNISILGNCFRPSPRSIWNNWSSFRAPTMSSLLATLCPAARKPRRSTRSPPSWTRTLCLGSWRTRE